MSIGRILPQRRHSRLHLAASHNIIFSCGAETTARVTRPLDSLCSVARRPSQPAHTDLAVSSSRAHASRLFVFRAQPTSPSDHPSESHDAPAKEANTSDDRSNLGLPE